MKNSIKSFIFGISLVALLIGFTSCTKKENTKVEQKDAGKKVVASTSWTAAFADIAGADEMIAIAPANLRHPPEYEITVEDIQKITESDVFIFAGFERMMKTIGDAAGNAEMVKIVCDNSIATVTESAGKIAEVLGTQAVYEKRLAEYKDVIAKGKAAVEKAGYEGARVVCNKNQTYLAKELGFEIAFTFGPGPVTSDQIAQAKTEEFAFIIDNVHNPVAAPLSEVAPDAKVLVWRNFPEKIERKALINVVQANIDMIK